MKIRNSFLGMGICLGLLAAPSFADMSAPDIQPAKVAAEKWLSLVDSGQYAKSWKESASAFREHITSDQWTASLTKVMGMFGKLLHRKLKSQQYLTSVPGGPPGQYVVLQFDASYRKNPAVVETVTPMLDKDGAWRVSGYYIK